MCKVPVGHKFRPLSRNAGEDEPEIVHEAETLGQSFAARVRQFPRRENRRTFVNVGRSNPSLGAIFRLAMRTERAAVIRCQYDKRLGSFSAIRAIRFFSFLFMQVTVAA